MLSEQLYDRFLSTLQLSELAFEDGETNFDPDADEKAGDRPFALLTYNTIVVFTKADLLSSHLCAIDYLSASTPLNTLSCPPLPTCLITCKDDHGIKPLLEILEEQVKLRVLPQGDSKEKIKQEYSPVITRQRHRALLIDCVESLELFSGKC